jgi:hypothetical protein
VAACDVQQNIYDVAVVQLELRRCRMPFPGRVCVCDIEALGPPREVISDPGDPPLNRTCLVSYQAVSLCPEVERACDTAGLS